MRVVLIVVAAIVVFVGTIAAALALTGNLNAGTIKQLAGMEEQKAPAQAAGPEDVGPLSTKIKEEQERLREWEKRLEERESRADQREQELDQMLVEVTKMSEEVKAALGQVDEQYTAALQLTAKTMEKMDPQQAAIDLAGMKPEDAAKIAPLISDRLRGAIFDEMDPKPRADLLQALQAKKL